MINLLTGLPGNGKTLFAIWFILQYVETENKRLKAASESTGCALVVRKVFYSGITDLTLPWEQIEPADWPSCPPGSIILIDEAQYPFSKKPNGAVLPAHYTELSTHRHNGFDIFLITQHPSLVDNFVRKLVGRHFHFVRKFGFQGATVYEWSAANNAPESAASQKSALPMKWRYPKEVFGYYKSAEVHTVKRSIPAKIILAVFFVIAMIVVFVLFLNHYQARGQSAESSSSSSSSASSFASGGRPGFGGGSSNGSSVDSMQDAKRFAFENTPRVVGVMHTAPKYDDMTKPVRVPVPAMCIRKGVACKCYTQQGTALNVPLNMCYEISYSGFFQEFNPEGVSDPGKAQSQGIALASAPSVRDLPSPAGQVVVMPYVPNSSRFERSASSK